MTQILIIASLLKYAERLRFRQLFLLTASLFVIDLLIPDLVPICRRTAVGAADTAVRFMQKDQTQRD
jgi:hypothetical protein